MKISNQRGAISVNPGWKVSLKKLTSLSAVLWSAPLCTNLSVLEEIRADKVWKEVAKVWAAPSPVPGRSLSKAVYLSIGSLMSIVSTENPYCFPKNQKIFSYPQK